MNNVHFVIDEAAAVLPMEEVENALQLGRGYGIRLQFYFQSLGQLKKCLPNGQDQTLMSNTTQMFFGVNDKDTAEMVSARLGEETIIVEGGGGNDSWSISRNQGENSTSSGSKSYDWKQQARRLLKPEEVATLDPRIAITFAPGMPPIWTRLIRYYEESSMGKSWWRAVLADFAKPVFIVTFAILLGMLALLYVVSEWKPSPPPQPYQQNWLFPPEGPAQPPQRYPQRSPGGFGG